MYKFLKLSNAIINPAKITKIIKYDNSYWLITDNSKSIRGFMFGWVGWVNTDENNTFVYKELNPEDYAAVEKWISDNT